MVFSQKHTHIAKGIAILLLLYYHMFIDYGDFRGFLALIAHSCVYVFVFLSGLGLTISFDKASSSNTKALSWIAKHIWKLEVFFWPHFLIGTLIYTIICKGSILAFYGNMGNLLLDFFCISDMVGGKHLLGVWWYMGLAIFIVLVLVLFAKAFGKIGWYIIPVTYALMLIIPNLFGKDAYDNPGPYKGYLLAVCLGVIFARKKLFEKYMDFLKRRSVLMNVILSAGCLTAVVVLTILLPLTRWNHIAEFLLLPQLVKTAVAILFVFFGLNLAELSIVSHSLEFLGKMSDDMFIIHIAIRVAFPPVTKMTAIPEVNYLIFLAAGIILTMAYKGIKSISKYDVLMEKAFSMMNRGNMPKPKSVEK